MTQGKLFPLALSGVLVSGCQVWQARDIESLPPTAALPEQSEPGSVELRYFDNVPGNRVEDFTGITKFPDNPDEVVFLDQLEITGNRADNYGSLVRGYITPPVDGLYRFFVAGDDQTQLLLSPDESIAGATIIATVPSYSSRGQYNKFSSQASAFIELKTGQRYYFEIRHKEGSGGDHFSVAWEGPSFGLSVIDGQHLYSLGQPSELYPEDELSSRGFALGYRIGFFDGQQSLPYAPGYPPMDEDQDGLYDNWEVQHGLDPTNANDASSDVDDDFLTAAEEFRMATDPTNADTDGDGIPDGAEFAFQLDPLDPADAGGDMDGDGFTNLEEYQSGTDMSNPDDMPEVPEAEPERTSGFVGQYFSGRNHDQFAFARMDADVSFDWGSGSPASGIPDNTFSVRWFTNLIPPHDSGNREYEFRAIRDDGIRVFLDGELILDAWTGLTTTQYTSRVTLAAGVEYPMTVEYNEGYGGARLSLDLVDMTTGATIDPGSIYSVAPLNASVSPDRDDDGIPDVWEMQYGMNPTSNDASVIYNDQGMTSIEAFQSGLHPWTLEEVGGWEGAEPKPEPEPEPEPEEPLPSGGQVILSWTAPGTRVDGSSIELSDIDSYEISYGKQVDTLNEMVKVPGESTSHTFDWLESGTWYFSIRVVDINGLRSLPSEVISHVVE